MPIRTSAPTVTTTATALGESSSRRTELVVVAPETGTVYIGGPTVTAANGYPLVEGDAPFNASRVIQSDSAPSEAWHAITSTGTATVRVLEIIA